MNNDTRRNLTEGSIVKSILHLAIPMMWSNVLITVLEVVDLLWIGKLGPTAIAAVAMSGSVLMIIFTIVIGVSIGTTATVSRFIGAKDYENANQAAMQSLLTGVAAAAGGAIISFFAAPMLLRLLGAKPDVIALGTNYLRIILCGGPVLVVMFLVSAILNGAGDSRTPMKIVAGVALLNLVLDPLLIFGIGFFPKMGVSGAALATTISRCIGAFVGLYILFGKSKYIQLHISKIAFHFGMIWRIVKIGIPGSLQMGIRSTMNMALMAIIASYGTLAIAAYGIIIRIEMFIMMPGFGLAMAASTLVGQNLGAGKPDRAQKSAIVASGMFMSIMLVFGLVFLTWYRQIAGAFSNDPEILDMVGGFIKVLVWGYAFTGLAIPLSRSIMGAGDTMPTLFITLVSLWGVLVPLAMYLSKKTSLGITGIWIAILIAVFLQATLTLAYFLTGRWKHKKV